MMLLIVCSLIGNVAGKGSVKKRTECLRFGELVRELRTKKGFSQESFAEEVGIHRTYIGGIERGERNPTLTIIYKIASALSVAPRRLLRS